MYDRGKICRICLGFECTRASACVCVCACVRRHAIKKCSPHYHSVLFSVPCAVTEVEDEKKKEKE